MRQNPPVPSHEMIAEASAWLIDFRTGELTQAERDRFNAWLCASPQHIQAYFEVAAAWSELPDKDPQGRIDIEALLRAAGESVGAEIVDFGGPSRPSEAPKAHHGVRIRTAIAACCALLLASAGTAWLYHLRGTYNTDTGEQRSLTLADGSTLELNAQTRVRVRYTDTERRIELLSGQALFRVAKNNARPFIVKTGDTQIRAIGTQFDIYRKTNGTTVTVVEGRVSVTDMESKLSAQRQLKKTASSAAIFLSAGEQLTLQPSHAVETNGATTTQIQGPHKADIAAATAWTQKRLVFDDTPLKEVVAEFNRYNLRPLVITDESLGHLGVTGLYSSTDPAALIAFLNAQPGIRVTETEFEIHVSRE